MKRRRNLVLAILLVAAMALSIGYATLTDVLTITGGATIDREEAEEAFNLDIKFTNAVVVEAEVAGNITEGLVPTESTVSYTDDTATFHAHNLRGKGDKAVFAFTVTNEGDVAATVAAAITNPDQENFLVEGAFNTDTLAANGGTVVYTVTVTLRNTPTEDLIVNDGFVINLTATSVEG